MSEPKNEKHSPTPWFRSPLITADDGWDYVEIGPYPLETPKDGYVEDEIATISGINHDGNANADYILRCVNSHEALLAALKEMRELNAACFRAIAKLDTGRRVGPPAQDVLLYEVRAAGIKDGVGVRAQQAISLAEAGDR